MDDFSTLVALVMFLFGRACVQSFVEWIRDKQKDSNIISNVSCANEEVSKGHDFLERMPDLDLKKRLSAQHAQREREKLRKQIFERDQGKCQKCGSKGHHIHHIAPQSLGGTDDPSNLVLLCVQCHSGEHGQSSDALIRESGRGSESKRAAGIRYLSFKR
ncbi:MAG: HNH endonuclease [Bacillota bacterium]